MVFALFLGACDASNGVLPGIGFGFTERNETREYSAEEIFAEGERLLKSGKSEDAATTFSEVERLFPYSDWARRAAMRQATAYNVAENYELSRAAAQRFIDFYPADPEIDRAYYLIALSYYDQIDSVSRDQGVAFQALQAFRILIETYPDSEYVNSALLKFDLAIDHLAAKEMEIGRYYLRRGNVSAAINRFRAVIDDYQTTSHTAEALHRLVESYLILGLTEEAKKAGAILGYNYQASEWYRDSYNLLARSGLDPSDASPDGDGWLSKIYRQVLLGQWL